MKVEIYLWKEKKELKKKSERNKQEIQRKKRIVKEINERQNKI